MKRCGMCTTEKEDTSTVQVLPATWNGFNHFADVCAECQTTKRFKTYSKVKPTKAAAAEAEAKAAEAEKPPVKGIQITHRRTGELLRLVESHTLAQAALGGADLAHAELPHATMRNADLLRADLHLANLAGANLSGADLRGANLKGADLRGTEFREARLARADLRGAVYDSSTRWPEGFDPRSSGARREGG